MLDKDRKHFTLLPISILYIKLGTKCNLHCKYCHQLNKDFELNEDIFDYISSLPNLKHIRISGGEPLLYMDTITKIRECAAPDIRVSMVSNGTLLNDETVKWLNSINVMYGISYDGENSYRGVSPNFEMLSKVERFSGVSTVVTKSFDYDKYYNDIGKAMEICGKNLLSYPYFIHQTPNSPNFDLVDKNTIDKYIEFICKELNTEFSLAQRGVELIKLPFLYRYIDYLKRGAQIGSRRGVRCCSEDYVPLLVDGRFMLCGYGNVQVGDIYKGIDWSKVESFIPAKCKNCEYWNVCRNSCIANITDNECYIFKSIYKYFKDMTDDIFIKGV